MPCRISRLSSKAASQGAIFSSSVPGRKPISSAMGGVERATINLRVALLLQDGVQAIGQRQQGLAGTGGAGHHRHIDAVVVQQDIAMACSRLRGTSPQKRVCIRLSRLSQRR